MLNGRYMDEGASARDADPRTSTTSPSNSAADPAEVKRLATVSAKLAMAGYCLLELRNGHFHVGRWTSAAELADLRAVEQFLQRACP
jgi:hypothetical protein